MKNSDYNVQNWMGFYSRSSLSVGPDSSQHAFYKVKKLKTYKNELSLLIQEIDRFVDSQPDLSEFTAPNGGKIYFEVADNGLGVYKWTLSDPGMDYFEVSTEGWESVKNYRTVFPKNFRSDFILIYIEFPDCIVFRGDETSKRSLVYTKDGKRPHALIAEYQSYSTCVRVEKLVSNRINSNMYCH